MSEDKLTIKEIQLFRFLHELRKILRAGEINITWHEHDFVNAALTRPKLDGDAQDIDEFKTLLITAFGDRA